MSTVRHPAVAGAFYPGDRQRLERAVRELLPRERRPLPAMGVLVPHAGYVYSGRCAAETMAEVAWPETVVLLGPNHTGLGRPLAAAAERRWSTPLGQVEVDRGLLADLERELPQIAPDAAAHRREHSLEVQLPLLQLLREDFTIAPLIVGTRDFSLLAELGAALDHVLASRPAGSWAILVSSDMTHYESAESAREKDEQALACLEALDAEGLHRTVEAAGISMCGAAPAVAALVALSGLGVRSAERVCYTHSGTVTGDDQEVVAYAGVVFRG